MTETVPYDIDLSRVIDALVDVRLPSLHRPGSVRNLVRPDRLPGRQGQRRDRRLCRGAAALRDGRGGRFFDANRFRGTSLDVIENELPSSSGAWTGIPGHEAGGRRTCVWSSTTRDAERGSWCARVLDPPGTEHLGRQAWEMMLCKLESLVSR